MAGASIFVMYANGLGNVTISARDGGQGHVEPQSDSNLQNGVTLLAGSGIVDGKMIANVHCPYSNPERSEDQNKGGEKEGKDELTMNRHNMHTPILENLYRFPLDLRLERRLSNKLPIYLIYYRPTCC